MIIQGLNNLASTYASAFKSSVQRQTSPASAANLAERVTISDAAKALLGSSRTSTQEAAVQRRIDAIKATPNVERTPADFEYLAENDMRLAEASVQAASKVVSPENGETLDFSNMSPQQLLQTMNDLIKAGKMSVDESSSLVGLIPIAISKVQYDGEVPAAYYAPTNFFEKLQQAMAYDQYSRNEQAVIYDRKAIAALERFQGTTA